jgi:hypothetical protein
MRLQSILTLSAVLSALPGLAEEAPAARPEATTIVADSTTAPAGCKFKDTDKGFPAAAEWKTISPNIKTREGPNRPDYHLSVKTLLDVQNAVQFAAKHNVRLSIVNSGHDFLAR